MFKGLCPVVTKSLTPFSKRVTLIIIRNIEPHFLGKLPGLVVKVVDSQSEPWSLDVSSIPRFALKLDGYDHLMAEKNENNKDIKKGQVTPKNYFF